MEFKGTISKGGGEFKSPGEGTHIMGLTAIKDCVKKFQGTERPGIQFNFRSADDPEATVTHRVSASLNIKSALYKTLRRMAPKSVSEATTPEEAKELLSKLENNWFEVTVIEAPGKDGRVYANIDDCLIKPARAEDCPPVKPFQYFAEMPKAKPAAAPAKEDDSDTIPF